jgi:four helix bundle protein
VVKGHCVDASMVNEGVDVSMKIFFNKPGIFPLFSDKHLERRKNDMTNRELEERLINFSAEIIDLTDRFRKDQKLKSLVEQINRSASSVALNYGEAQSAESKKDFIHKIGLVMKELRETFANLRIMERLSNETDKQGLQRLIHENDELLAIFYKTLQTAKKGNH